MADITDLHPFYQVVVWSALYDCRTDEDPHNLARRFDAFADLLRRHATPSPFKSTLSQLYPDQINPYADLYGFPRYVYNVPLYIPFPDDKRFFHTWITGDSGSGKTTLVENLIWHDLEKVEKGEASVVIMDSQGRQELLGRIIDRYPCTIIDSNTPLNIFAMPRLPSNTTEREILYTNTIDNIVSVFSTVLGEGAFTGKQSTLFHFAAMLICAAEGNIRDMKHLMGKGGIERYRFAIPKLPRDAQEFFKTQFDHPKQYSDTKQELTWRLDKLLSRQAFARLFTQEKNLDLFSLMNEPRCIIVDTDITLMGKEGTAIFGRTILSMLFSASQQRLLMQKNKRLATYCYIDEANEYIATDETVADILNKARKLNVAFTFSHPSPHDITSPVVLKALERAGMKFRASGNYHFTYEARDQIPYQVTSKPVHRKKIEKLKAPEYVYRPTIIPESHRLTYEGVRALPAPDEDDIKPR